MQTLMKQLGLACVALLAIGCGSSPTSPSAPAAPNVRTITIDGFVPFVGTSTQLTATAGFSDGSKSDITSLAAWSSSNTQVASVSSGQLTGRSVGVADITASYQGISTTSRATITANFQGSWVGDFSVTGCSMNGQIASVLAPCVNGFQIGQTFPVRLILTQTGTGVSGTVFFGTLTGAVNGGVDAAGHLSLSGTVSATFNTTTFTEVFISFDATTNGQSMFGGWTLNLIASGLTGSATIQDTIRVVTRQ